jgi:peroxiredoxin
MLWIRFDEEDRRSPAPDFCLEDTKGEQVCQSSFRGDCNLVILFAHSAQCPPCLDLIRGFEENREKYQKEDARILVVLPAAAKDAGKTGLAESLSGSTLLTILSDPQGEARKKYASLMVESLIGAEDAALFILDSYGAPYAAAVGRPEVEDEAIHPGTLSWLSFIGMQCPE